MRSKQSELQTQLYHVGLIKARLEQNMMKKLEIQSQKSLNSGNNDVPKFYVTIIINLFSLLVLIFYFLFQLDAKFEPLFTSNNLFLNPKGVKLFFSRLN